ncbi:MAG: asparagine synthase (glutamine-hydrolyzing) [Candidatus Saccharibacteria bacterium]
MCGIAGLVLNEPRRLTSDLINTLLKDLEHRGPDDYGCLNYSRGNVWSGKEWVDSESEAVLLHRRLSILDLSSNGWQPMSYTQRFHIVFNGEIYNYIELRTELEALGYSFKSSSDTEVLLAAYSHWQTAAFNRLVGMFALAILDTDAGKIIMARDPFGIKPLYYTKWSNGLAFASEIPTLLDLPGVNRKVDPERLYDYLRLGITDHGSKTMFADVQQLPAAHYMEVNLSTQQINIARYWQLNLSHKIDISFEEAAELLREKFLKNIRLHLRSDVPVGAALSGGIDSSSIVAAMRSIEPDLDIRTFSYIADDQAINEESWVDIISNKFYTDPYKVKLSSDELVDDLKQLILCQGEPFISSSMFAQNRVFKLAHDTGIKVMLDGQGADELLGGYPVFTAARLASLIRNHQWVRAYKFYSNASKMPGRDQIALQSGMYLFHPSIQKKLRRLVGKQDMMPTWMIKRWFDEREVGYDPPQYTTDKNVLSRELHQAATITNLPMLLRYEDRNSMAYSIESRVPFLTAEIAEFIFSLPEQFLISPAGESKSVFRLAMRGIVPDEILDRKDKIGFATPEQNWLSRLKPWVEQLLQSEVIINNPALNVKVMKQEWDSIISGNKPFHPQVWRWINLIEWSNTFKVTFA